MNRKLRPLAALAVVALISAGCANPPAGTSTGSSGGNATIATREQALKFAECMRANGVKEFPDPNAVLPIASSLKGTLRCTLSGVTGLAHAR